MFLFLFFFTEHFKHNIPPKNKSIQHNNYEIQSNDQSTSCIEDGNILKLILPNMENLENNRYPKNKLDDVISFRQNFLQKYFDLHPNYEQMLINIDCDYDLIFKKTLNINTKLLPEERVALFKKTMENYVYPLKVTVNDIINKCTNLGIYHLLKESKKNVNMTNETNNNYFKNTCKSNRMVYSIIFDE